MAETDSPTEVMESIQDEEKQPEEGPPGEEASAGEEVQQAPETPEPESEPPEVSARGSSALKTRGPESKIKYLNILNHGDTGAGKTMFCGTMIKAMDRLGLKTLAIVFDEGELLTLDQAGIRGYDYYVITDYEKQLWPLYMSLRKNKPGYGGVFIDGLGDFQQAAKDYELRGDDKPFKFMEEAMKGNKRMFLQNWGNLLEMTRHFLEPFLKLPLHKIITCISEPDDDPKTGKPKLYPGLQGSLQQLISAHFSVVGFSYVAHWGDQTYWCLTTQPHEAISTKDRTGLCRVQVNPQFQTFMDALDGKKPKPDTKKSQLEDKLARALVVRPQTSRITVSESKEKEKES